VPIASIDQLYMQAYLVAPLFLERVRTWALDSGAVEYADIKRVDRAVEKASRSYDNKVCKLVDVVRQSIVYEKLEDMVLCLQRISDDPQVRILRIKNRFAQDYSAEQESGGYRDVALNLVIVNEETLALGVAGHVCELHLMFKSFHRIKTDECHQRYVAFRNKRAE